MLHRMLSQSSTTHMSHRRGGFGNTTTAASPTAVHPLYVHSQIVLHPERLVADGTGVGSLARVHDAMFAQGGQGDKALLAVVALVRSVAAVIAPMFEQGRVGREGLGTRLTLKDEKKENNYY